MLRLFDQVLMKLLMNGQLMNNFVMLFVQQFVLEWLIRVRVGVIE